MKRRVITLLLSIVLAVSCITPAVYAGTQNINTTVSDNSKVEIYNGSYAYVNPLYADTVDVSDLKYSYSAPVLYSNGVEVNEEDYCTSLEEAGQEMRDNIVAREEVIEVKIKTEKTETYDDAQFKQDMATIVNYAMEHTGVGNEGDYLKWQYAGWGATSSTSYSTVAGVTTYYSTITYTFTYYTTAAQEEEMNTAVTEAIESITTDKRYDIYNASDYLKVSAIYDYLCENIEYDNKNLEDDTYKLKHTAYAALINKTAVCQGYAVLFYRMALEMGVDSRVITGIGNGGDHAWNIVELHDKYYNLDSTWDAGVSTYGYFLKCTANFDDHTRDAEYDTDDFNTAYPMGEADYVTVEEDNWENVADALADIKSMQLGLSDKISVQFLVDVDETVVSGTSNGSTEDDYMIVAVGDNDFYEIYVSDTTTQTSNLTGEEYRVFEVELNSKQMTDSIAVEMIVDGYIGEVVKTSIKKYADTILSDTTGTYDSDKDMVRAMLNYGGYAQAYFDNATEGLANEGLYTSETDPVANWGAVDMGTYKHTLTTAADTKGITANSATLVLESQTELRVYFSLENGKTLEDYEFELNDNTKVLETGYNSKKGKYYVAIPDIGPAALQNKYTLTVTPSGESDAVITVNYGAMSYARTILNNSATSDKLKNLVKALYLYNQAALNYTTAN